MGGIPIVQFCGLRAKCYSILSVQGQRKAAAGVRQAQQDLLKHTTYVEVLAEGNVKHVTQRSIRSQAHQLYTREETRVGISSLDIKRFISSDNITTYPYGYFEN